MFSIPLELARSALDAAPDAMLIIDSPGTIRYANRQILTLFGYSHEAIVGQPVELLVPERFRGRHLLHRRQYAESGQLRPMGQGLALFGRRRDGSEFSVEISLSPITHAGSTLVAAAIRDVSDRKQAEAELTTARETAVCARERADRARDAAIEARESADRANQGKSRFLATASHDLRQPLQTLALLSGALRRMALDSNAAEVLTQQEQAIGTMSRLLNALLDISKLESGAVKPTLGDFDLGGVLKELRSEFAQLAASKGIELTIEDGGLSVRSDRALIEQVLRNFLSNAIKYTARGGVTLRSSRDASSAARVEIIDTGIGIPADQLRYVFDEFYQVGIATNSSREGYGLGLSIVQRIVKLLDVRLEVRSEVGQGSVFALLLPAAAVARRSESAPAPTPAAPRPNPNRPGVLLVEDDAGVRDATRLLLKVEGYRVTAAASMEEAVQAAQAGARIELLVSDYHLGNGTTGVDVIARLREIRGAGLRAILITGDTSAAVQELTCDPRLRVAAKPVRAEELLGLMKALLAT